MLALQDDSSTTPIIIDLISDDEKDHEGTVVHTREGKPPSIKIGSPARHSKQSHAQVNQVEGETDQGDDRKHWGAGRKSHYLPSTTESKSTQGTESTQGTASVTGLLPLASAMLGLDRATMEAERLARQQHREVRSEETPLRSDHSNKRHPSISPGLLGSQDGRQVKAKYSAAATKQENSIASHTTLSSRTSGRSKEIEQVSPIFITYGQETTNYAAAKASNEIPHSEASSSTPQRQALQVLGVQYPDGVVKRTWVKGCPDEDDTIKIEDVLQKEDLDLAVLSTFQLDADWITSKLLEKTKVVWILHGKDEDEKRNLAYAAPKNYRFCFPHVGGNVNIMHSKLQLLAHPTHLRVVVPSANLVPYDWGESGVMENVCFLIDLPRLPEGLKVDPDKTSDFGFQLTSFVRAMGLDKKIVDSMSRFDFSHTFHIGFVHSIGGAHLGERAKRTGYPSLAAAVRSLKLETTEAVNVDIMASSIGSINENFVKAIYLAAQGDDGSTEHGSRHSKLPKGKADSETDNDSKLSNTIKNYLRVHFPSKETVAQTKGGVYAAGTICFKSRWYNAKTFPRDLMRDAKSTRNVLMHNKMIFVQTGHPRKEGGKAWAYIGSHNLSESAWGRMVKDKTKKVPRLNCRNWECGVIFPVPADGKESGDQDGVQSERNTEGDPDFEVFRGHVPVPMIIPSQEYGAKRPWFFME